MELIPEMVKGDSREKVMDILRDQTEQQWTYFFNSMGNSDLKDQFLGQIAKMVDYVYSQVLMDSTKMMMANMFLMTQKLPPISTRKLLPSIVDLISSCLKVLNRKLYTAINEIIFSFDF